MSETGAELSFDRADFVEEQTKPACAACKKPLAGQYWTCQGQVLCEGCGVEVASELEKPGGSWLRAFFLGGFTALGLGIAYALFVHFAEIQFALITLGIAYLIAKVVRQASAGRGGLRYQLLAVALTYFAACMGYAPGMYQAMTDDEVETAAHEVPPESAAMPANDVGAVTMVVGAVVASVLAMAAPIWMAFEAPIGTLIVLLSLWEAWKLTRRLTVQVDGPFRVGEAQAAPA
jgi:hypothetical protein